MTLETAAVRIRRYQEADRDAVLALAPRLTEGVASWRDPEAVLAAVQGWVSGSADSSSDDARAFYVATAASQVVGLITLSEHQHFSGQTDAYVGELVVSPAWEGHGIARQLIAAAQTWAATRGYPFLTLHTGAANHPARACYAALGFAEETIGLTKPVAPR